MRTVPVVALLAGCATAPLVPEGTDFIRISSGSSIVGQTADTIYANEMLKRETLDPDERGRQVSWAALPDGTYSAARGVLERRIPILEPPDFTNCSADQGVNRIEISEPVESQSVIVGGCKGGGYFLLRDELLELVPPWSDAT